MNQVNSNSNAKTNWLSYIDLSKKIQITRTPFGRLINSSIPLLSLAVKEVSKIYFLVFFTRSDLDPGLLAIFWQVAQLVFGTIFGYYSDKFHRKLLLSVTLFGTLTALISLNLNIIWLAIILDGVFGNITNVARAAYLDVTVFNNKRISLVFTFVSQTLTWVIICLNNTLFVDLTFWIALSITSATLILAIVLFVDKADIHATTKDNPSEYQSHLKEDHPSALETLRRFGTLSSFRFWLAFVLLSLNFHLISYQTEVTLRENLLRIAFFSQYSGITLGLLLHFLYHFRHRMPSLHFTALGSLLLAAFWYLQTVFFPNDIDFPFTLYLQIATLSGFAWPLVFAAYADHAKKHETGFLFGLLDSSSGATEFVAPTLLLLTSNIQNVFFVWLMIIPFFATLLTIGKHISIRNHQSNG